MTKQKKVTKKEKDTFEIEVLKLKIESAKTGFNRYVDVIVRKAFIDNCTGGAYFNTLYHKLISNGLDSLDVLEEGEVKNKLSHEFLFGEPREGKFGEKERLEENLKYWKRLSESVQCTLKNMNDDKKKEIIVDTFEQQSLWSDQFNRNSKIYNEVEKLKEKKKK